MIRHTVIYCVKQENKAANIEAVMEAELICTIGSRTCSTIIIDYEVEA